MLIETVGYENYKNRGFKQKKYFISLKTFNFEIKKKAFLDISKQQDQQKN